MQKTVIYSHPDCLLHDPGAGHPESPARLQVILDLVDEYREAPKATDTQILLAHSPALLEHLKKSSPQQGIAQLDADTLMSQATLDAAYRASGAACKAVDELMADSIQRAFCATRPPGHHATATRAMGFCFFNHIAIAALYAQQTYKLERIAIVDFDVHHGNGTQDIVKGKNGLLYISTHQSPFYPGSGSTTENINGNILNIPLAPGTGDKEYQQIFSATAIPALQSFRPQLLLVSAGFDAHHADPLAGLNLTTSSYQWLGEKLGKLADEYADGKMLSILEGGYDIAALRESYTGFIYTDPMLD
tara:strand:- start:50264 stop:51175 length:912 start_codon:yes stop_codon:yes gene_type:complete